MKIRSSIVTGLIITGLVIAGAYQAKAEVPVSIGKLSKMTHFHGIAVDAKDPNRLYLATHHGFFTVSMSGMAMRLSNNRNDYMGFTPHPSEPDIFYASGHPAGGGNTGFIMSADGGRTWKLLSKGVRGPVDFHQMDVSKSDPKTVYGNYGGLQMSKDGGRTWQMKAKVPPGLIDLTVSATNVNTLYAATKEGLLVSTDVGQSWQPAHLNRSLATMVQSTNDGSVYAFVHRLGLIRSSSDSLRWEILNNTFGESYLLHLAIDPTNSQNLFAITNKGGIISSRDRGKNWADLQ
jgi:photosystem II stability/assembly factor-like uncharacterized protein